MKMKKIISIMLTMLLTMTVLGACNLSNTPSSTVATKLMKYDSYKALQDVIDKNIKEANLSGRVYDGMKNTTQEAAQDTTGNGSLRDYSKTNLQVEGVDEADIVKTDGKYLYIIANGRFIIVDAKDPANMKITSQIQYLYVNEPAKNTVTPIEMLLDETNNRITLISYSYDDRQTKAMLTEAAKNPSSDTKPGVATGSKDIMIAPDYFYYGQQNVLAQVIDLTDITKPAIVREFSQEGNYISSRRIDEFVYIITNKYIYTYADTTNKDFYIPATKDSLASGDWAMLPIDSISVVPNQIDSSFLVLSSLNTKALSSPTQSKAILGAGQNVYASPTNIYIASSRYTYEQVSTNTSTTGTTNTVTAVAKEGTATAVNPETKIASSEEGSTGEETAQAQDSVAKDGDATEPNTGTGSTTPSDTTIVSSDKATTGDAVVTITKDIFRVYEAPVYKVFTDIYRFGIDKGAITEKGSSVVPGYVLNQFSMDENNGYFRIATTTGDTWRSDQYTSMNNVYVLDQNLKIAGKIEGLASRETIKSVRFLGNKAYLVTFRTVDPLFVLDMTDPKNPIVKGELKIPGYSEYLHPISDTIVVGFGKDAFEENNMAYYLGFKISVFDVSDVSNPKEISNMIIGDRGTYSELSTNHKALLYSKEKNIIGFPITIYEVPASQKSDKHAYGMPTYTGYIVLGLTADNKLFEKGRVSHYTLTIPAGYPTDYTQKTEAWSEFELMYKNEYLYKVNRGMFIGDTLFTVSNAYVKASSLADFKDISKIDVPGFTDYYTNAYPEKVR